MAREQGGDEAPVPVAAGEVVRRSREPLMPVPLLRGPRASESLMTVLVAFSANLLIAVAKPAAAAVTGSASLTAEAAHSWADCGGLSEAPGHTVRMSTLAMLAEGSLPRLSQVVSRLERRGWVRRTPDPADGRYTLAILTDEGRAKVVATGPGHVETVRRLVFDPLTKAQSRQLREIGRRIIRAIDPGDPCLHDRPIAAAASPAEVPA
jgi:DNA-binding MarR family transcriptional regulator